jgi:Uma2 family endonuclease
MEHAPMNSAVEQWPRTHLLNVDEYYKMAQAGVLAPDARVELIEGVIVDMAPIGSLHGGVVNYLTKVLTAAVGDRGIVSVQSAVRLSWRSEPQPDFAILKPRADYYRSAHPTPADVLLIIEVSDSTLAFDRGPKLALYARHAIPEVWVVDLLHNQLHCMREPAGEGYAVEVSLEGTVQVAPAALPDVQIDVAKLFS